MSQASFESYAWPEDRGFDLIFMGHAVGYLDDERLVQFLVKSKNHLTSAQGNTVATRTRASGKKRRSYLLILDTVGEEGKRFSTKGQRIRAPSHLKSIFDRAGLAVFHETPSVIANKSYLPVKIWVLG